MLSKRKPKYLAKNLSAAFQAINSRRPSKPNLLNAPKPLKLLAPTGLHRTLSSLTYQIPQSRIASTKMNWSLLSCFSSTKMPPHWYGYGEIRIWLNVPLKDISMERMREEEFGESKYKDCDESILFFSMVPLSKFSMEALYNTWV